MGHKKKVVTDYDRILGLLDTKLDFSRAIESLTKPEILEFLIYADSQGIHMTDLMRRIISIYRI